ncbi:hypothetical protein [Gimesia panareensis]|nr:hypothetical protein [Gimesia panareensis]
MKRELRPVGFFNECFGGSSGPALMEAVRPSSHAEENEMASYLDQGKVFACIMGQARDVLSPDREVAGSGACHILTDGVWAWPAFLSHYLRRYHVELPVELWEQAKRRAWTVPVDIDLAELSLE